MKLGSKVSIFFTSARVPPPGCICTSKSASCSRMSCHQLGCVYKRFHLFVGSRKCTKDEDAERDIGVASAPAYSATPHKRLLALCRIHSSAVVDSLPSPSLLLPFWPVLLISRGIYATWRFAFCGSPNGLLWLMDDNVDIFSPPDAWIASVMFSVYAGRIWVRTRMDREKKKSNGATTI